MQVKNRYSKAINNLILDKLCLENAKWNWSSLSSNENITWDIVKENIERPWDWRCLTMNKNITWEIIKENIDLPWNWYELSRNENITWEIVKTNIDKPWDWYGLSSNKIITWDIVKENINLPWNWLALSSNGNKLLSLDDKKNIVLEHHAASVIQRVWRMVVSNPDYLVCKKRLLREYASLDVL